MAELREQQSPALRNPNSTTPNESEAGITAHQPMSRRERRELESAAAGTAVARVASVPRAESAASTSNDVARKVSGVVANKSVPVRKSRVPKITKRGVASATVMTFAAGLIATLALPAYAFGNGVAGFDASNTTSQFAAPVQTMTTEEAADALAISRDNYVAPTSAQLAADRKAAEEAAAATAAAAAAAASAASSTSGAAAAGPSASTFAANPPSGAYSGAAVVAYASQFVGVVPYGNGANPNDSFGCDGLTQYVFGQFGIYLPRMVSNQAAAGIRIAPGDAQAGDLVVWPGEHIGIYDGTGGVIHAPDWGRMVEHNPGLWGSYYFVRIV